MKKSERKWLSLSGINLEVISFFADQLLLFAQHRQGACKQTETIPRARVTHIPEGSEGHSDPGAPAGSPVCCLSLETLPQVPWDDL